MIPTLPRPETLARTLDRLARQRPPPSGFEVVVVHGTDAPDPATLDAAIGTRPYPVRRIVISRTDVSSKRNAGWRALGTPLILFMGDDILASPGLIRAHLDAHASHPAPEVGILGYVRWATWPPPSAFMRWVQDGIQFDFRGLTPGADAGWWHFYTANASVKRTMLERVGGFDEDAFPFGYEDLDLGARMAEHGFRLRYEPGALASHLHPQGIEDWQDRVRQIAVAERAFCARHPAARAYFHDLFEAARQHPPARGRGAHLARVVPRRTPWLGPRVWASFDMRNRQALAGPFLAAWDAAGEP